MYRLGEEVSFKELCSSEEIIPILIENYGSPTVCVFGKIIRNGQYTATPVHRRRGEWQAINNTGLKFYKPVLDMLEVVEKKLNPAPAPTTVIKVEDVKPEEIKKFAHPVAEEAKKLAAEKPLVEPEAPVTIEEQPKIEPQDEDIDFIPQEEEVKPDVSDGDEIQAPEQTADVVEQKDAPAQTVKAKAGRKAGSGKVSKTK